MWVGLGLALLGSAAAGGCWWQAQQWPRRFAAVEEGRLYRSGEISPRQLETVVRAARLRTVLSLLDPSAPESVAERQAAERLGLRWINVPLRGNGESTPEARDQIRAVLADESLSPLLVHCAAGVNRTGLAVGMYRLHHDGWTLEQVFDELRRFDFQDLEKHENLRQALRAEAERARAAATQAARPG